MSSAYYVCCIFSNAPQSNFIPETSTINTDQIDSKGVV